MRSAFFREDDYCQVEILPVTVHGYCVREMGRIDEFASAHWDGAGFTDIYMRGGPPDSLGSLGITLADLCSGIGAALAPFDQVYTGYSSHRETCQSVHAWGINDSEAVFAGVGADGVVRAIWLSLHGISPDQVGPWCRALQSLPRSPELLLADWNSSEVVLLTDESGLVTYLRGYHAQPGAEADPPRGR